MEERVNELRRAPLRIAGVIGLGSALLYLAAVVGQDDTTALPQAVFWFAVMAAAGLLAWFADQSAHQGRRMAMIATGLFFVIGLLTQSTPFVVIYLVAVVLSVLGFAGTATAPEETSVES